MTRVEKGKKSQAPESLQLIESTYQVSGFVFLSSPRPGQLHFPGSFNERRVADDRKWGPNGMPLTMVAERLVQEDEWGVIVCKRRFGTIRVNGQRAHFETDESKEPSIAYLADESSIRTIDQLEDWVPAYRDISREELSTMKARGVKGVLTTRTGAIRYYVEGDTIIVKDNLGFHQKPL